LRRWNAAIPKDLSALIVTKVAVSRHAHLKWSNRSATDLYNANAHLREFLGKSLRVRVQAPSEYEHETA